jgi:hypothetical protein
VRAAGDARRAKIAGMVLTTLLAVALAQGESSPPGRPAPAAATEPAAVAAVAYSDQQAAQAIDAWKRVSAKAPLADRVAGIEALRRGKHDSLVPVLEKVVRNDGSLAVRRKAAEALAWQPDKKAYPVVTRLLDESGVGKVTELLEPLVQSLARVGYQSKNWSRLEAIFRAGYAADRIAVQRAIVVLAGEHREKQAVALLLDNMDEPVPADPHGASNPPAEYWEARWKAWKTWRDDVKTALQRITGQKFASAAEARAWLAGNGAKIGLKGFQAKRP